MDAHVNHLCTAFQYAIGFRFVREWMHDMKWGGMRRWRRRRRVVDEVKGQRQNRDSVVLNIWRGDEQRKVDKQIVKSIAHLCTWPPDPVHKCSFPGTGSLRRIPRRYTCRSSLLGICGGGDGERRKALSIYSIIKWKEECFKSSLNNKVGNYLNEYANQRLNVTSSVSDNHKSASTVHTQPKNSSRSWRLKGLQQPQEPTELLTSLWCCGQSDIGISIWSGLVSEFNTSVVAPADCSTSIGDIHSKAYPGNKYPPEEHPLGYLFIHSKQRLSLFSFSVPYHTPRVPLR